MNKRLKNFILNDSTSTLNRLFIGLQRIVFCVIMSNLSVIPLCSQSVDQIPPVISHFLINNGSPQRSTVKSIEIHFDDVNPVNIIVSDLILHNLTTDTFIDPIDMSLNYDPATNIAVWIFPGQSGQSLPDGNYTATLIAANIADSSGNLLDGNGDGNGGDNYEFDFYRYFGDSDGDRDVDFADLFAYIQTHLKTNSDPSYDIRFDNDGDGDVDFADLFRFRQKHQTNLAAPLIITAALNNDTAPNGMTNTDGFTFDPTITGRVAFSDALSELRARWDSGVADYTINFQANGGFLIDSSDLASIAGGSLADGSHTLELTAVDAFNVVVASINVGFVLDTTAPAIQIISPDNGDIVNLSVATLDGSSSDDLSGVFEVLCNSASAAAAGGDFTCDVALVDGVNTIVIKTTDHAGNTVSTQIQVIRPNVTVSTTNTNQTNIDVTGFHVPDSTIRVEGGSSIVNTTANSSGQFSINVPLQSNRINHLSVFSVNSQGTSQSPHFADIIQDSQPPSLFIDFPVDGAELTNDSIVVAGRVGDVLSGFMGLGVTVNGQPANVIVGIGTNGTYERGAVPLALGANAITVTATDTHGNSTNKSITVSRIDVPAGAPLMAATSGDMQTAQIQSLLPQPVVVKVTQADGTPIQNKVITFDVTRNNGRLSANPPGNNPGSMKLQIKTDTGGEAKAYWTLGSDAGCGNNRIAVTSRDVAGTVFFCASANPAPAGQINIGDGNNQTVEIGASTPQPLQVWVNDACNGVPNTPVTFTVIEGGGKVNGADATTVNTSITGHAEVQFTAGPLPGNYVIVANFSGNSTNPATFVLYGVQRDFGLPASFTGIVLDNAGQPITGAECVLDVGGTSLPAVITDADGSFTIDDIPTGSGHLHIDGSVATAVRGVSIPNGTFPALGYEVTIIPNVVNSLPQPIFLPELNPNNEVVYDGTQDVELTVEGIAGLKMIVKAGSMRRADGTIPSPSDPATISLNQVHIDDIPMPLPNGASPPYAGTLQPAGALFDPPIAIEYPNMAGLPPGSIVYFMSFNHDTNRFETIGTGSVSDDGSTIISDPGSGISVAGWHANCPPYSVTGTVYGLLPIILEVLFGPDYDNPQSPGPPKGEPCPGDSGSGGSGLADCQTCSIDALAGKTECGSSNTQSQASGCGQKQILIHNGEERYEVTDLEIPGRGLNWKQTRVYRSQRLFESCMGVGWSHVFQDSIVLLANGSVRSFGGTRPGDTDRFDDWVPDPANSDNFIPPKAIFSRLIRNGTQFILIDRDGSRREYQLATSTIAPLSAIEDRFGNRMKLFYEDAGQPTLLTRINDTLGRDIHYQYYPGNDPVERRRNKLAKIIDFIGREINYNYDQLGDLIEAVSPSVTNTVTGNDFPNGKKETYIYSTGFPVPELNHNLLSVTRGNEHDPDFGLPVDTTKSLRWTYNLNDRVTSHTIGALVGPGAAGGKVIYDYADNPPPPPDFDPVLEEPAFLKITETDRNRNVRVYWIDDFGALTRFEHFTKGLRPGEPGKYLKRYKINGDNRNTCIEKPEGDHWLMTYDSNNPDPRQRANRLRAVHVPDTRGGDQTQIKWRYAYDPFYNQPCLIIDPRAFDPAFTPPNGGPVARERYSTVYIFDYQEGPDNDIHKQRLADKFGMTLQEVKDIIDYNEAQVEDTVGLPPGSYSLLGRGDINGDGRTDQIDGNHVKLIQPSATLIPGSNQAAAGGNTIQVVGTIFAYDDHGQKIYEIDPVGNVTDYSYFPASDPNGDGDISEVANPRSGNAYLREVVRDGRELAAVVPRQASADGVALANLTTAFERDTVGNIIGMTDPRGNTWTYIVNELDQVIRTIEPMPYNYSKDIIYDANNNVVQVRIDNRVPALSDNKPQYDAGDNLIIAAGAPNQTVNNYTYDILDNLVIEDLDATGSTPDRLVTEYDYDGNENHVRVIKPELNVIETVYDERDLVFSVTTGAGSTGASIVTYNYDNNDNIIAMIDAEDNNGDAEPESTIVEYDGYDRLKRTIDAVGNIREIIYDAAGNPVEEQYFGAVGGASPTDNSGSSNVLLSRTIKEYDELNRGYQTNRWLNIATGTFLNRSPVAIDGGLSPADGFVSMRTEYDAASRITFSVEDDLDVIAHVYDGINRRIKTLDSEDNAVVFIYDQNSNILQITETDRSQLGTVPDEIITTTNSYDVLNRLTITVDNLVNTDRFGYDSRNNRTVHEDALGNTKLTVYDGANRVIATHTELRVDGTGSTARDTSQSGDGFISVFYGWDGNSRLQTLTDDSGNQTIYAYDDLDRKISCSYGNVVAPALADTQDSPTSEQWFYDQDHNITNFTDQNGSTHTYTYDGLNRRNQCDITFAAGNPHNLSGTTQQTWQYDGLSRKTRCTDNNTPADPEDDVLCTYGYDTLSRKLEETCQIGSLPVKITSYKYDESLPRAGNLDPTSMVYPDGREIEYSFDRINRMNRINDIGQSAIVDYKYIGQTPRVLARSYQNNTKTTISYDGIRRPIDLLTVHGLQPVVHFQHEYDAEDNILNERKLHDPGNSELYAYDSAYRLVNFERGTLNAGGTAISAPTVTANALQNRDWTLDGVGNWSENDIQVVGGVLEIATRQHTNFNEFVDESFSVGGGSTPRSLAHDNNGNQVDNEIYIFSWDALNRLRTVTDSEDAALVAAYSYDCQNRRISKTLPTAPSTLTTTHFYYSNWRVCEEYAFDGNNETLKVQYVWGSIYHDELIVRDDRQGGVTVAELNNGVGSDRQFQHHNTLFSIFAVTDETSAVLERYQYDPYGQLTVFSPTFDFRPSSLTEQEFGYTGQRFDPETDLYYYKNRYYSPDQGRFISRDPIGYKAGDPNLYGYVENHPIGTLDPFGLAGCNDDSSDKALIQILLYIYLEELGVPAAKIDRFFREFPSFWLEYHKQSIIAAAQNPLALVGGRFVPARGMQTPIVLGESVRTRVGPAAERMGGRTFQPRSLDPSRWKINQTRWIREQIRSGRRIYDVGTDRLRPSRSEYYKIEKRELLDAGYKRIFRREIRTKVDGKIKRLRLYEWVKD